MGAHLVFLRLLGVIFVAHSCHGTSGNYVLVPGVGSYALHEETKTFSAAAQKCREEGAHLAVLNSKAEEDVLMNLFQQTSFTEAYVGVNDIDMEGFWIIVFGEMWSSVGYTKWGNDQPDQRVGNEDCAALHKKTRTLHDYPCKDRLSFFCEMDNNSSSPVKDPAGGITFSGGYVTVPGVGSYKFHKQQESYSEAAEICASEDAHLVVINSKQEEDVVINFLGGFLYSEAFVGINDLATEEAMVTVLGEPLDSEEFYRWVSGHPKNANGIEHCAVILKDREMTDVMCGKRYSFICEKYEESFPKTARTGGYVTVPGLGSYILHDHGLPYHMAAQMCENEGSQLAVINSKKEEYFLMRLLEGSTENIAFVGINGTAPERDTMTKLGERQSRFGDFKWAPREPSDADNKKGCAAIGEGRLLKDLKCAWKIAYFCERLKTSAISAAQALGFSIHTILSIYIFLYFM